MRWLSMLALVVGSLEVHAAEMDPTAPTLQRMHPVFFDADADVRFAFGRARRLHQAGNLLTGINYFVAPIGLSMTIAGVNERKGAVVAVGALLMTSGIVGLVGGSAASAVGGIRATRLLAPTATTAFGTAGLVLLGTTIGGGLVLGVAKNDFALLGLAAFAPAVTAILGGVQMSVGKSRSEVQISVYPTPGGLQIAGRF